MDVLGEALEALRSLAEELFSFALKGGKIFLWALAAVVILPCVFVAHAFYPIWEEWGKDF